MSLIDKDENEVHTALNTHEWVYILRKRHKCYPMNEEEEVLHSLGHHLWFIVKGEDLLSNGLSFDRRICRICKKIEVYTTLRGIWIDDYAYAESFAIMNRYLTKAGL